MTTMKSPVSLDSPEREAVRSALRDAIRACALSGSRLGTQALLAEMMTRTSLARRKGHSYVQQDISYWMKRGFVPAAHAACIEEAVQGAVLRHRICPSVFEAPEPASVWLAATSA